MKTNDVRVLESNELLSKAEIGCAKSQQELSVRLMKSSSTHNAIEAYKWMFISLALGNQSAKESLLDLHDILDSQSASYAYQEAEQWFDAKYDEVNSSVEKSWATELLQWCSQSQCAH